MSNETGQVEKQHASSVDFTRRNPSEKSRERRRRNSVGSIKHECTKAGDFLNDNQIHV